MNTNTMQNKKFLKNNSYYVFSSMYERGYGCGKSTIELQIVDSSQLNFLESMLVDEGSSSPAT